MEVRFRLDDMHGAAVTTQAPDRGAPEPSPTQTAPTSLGPFPPPPPPARPGNPVRSGPLHQAPGSSLRSHTLRGKEGPLGKTLAPLLEKHILRALNSPGIQTLSNPTGKQEAANPTLLKHV